MIHRFKSTSRDLLQTANSSWRNRTASRAQARQVTSSLVTILILSSYAFSDNNSTGSVQTKPLATIIVEAGEHTRIDTPVWISTNDIEFDFENQPLVLVDINGQEEREVDGQYEAGNPAKLWFCLSGTTEAGTKRTFKLYARPGTRSYWRGVLAEKDDKVLTLKRGNANILSYQYAVMPAPAGQRSIYDRSGFIYPLWSPAGNIVTEIHPRDHVHHMGIWMPWTHTLFEGKRIDFWNVQDGTGTVRFSKFNSSTSGPIFGGFKAEQEHVGLKTSEGEKVILNEIWDVRAYNVGGQTGGYWIVDFKSTQRNITDKPLVQEQYHYGGFAYRGATEWKGVNKAYLTSEGDTQANANGKRSRWCDISGAINGQWEGVTIFSNPNNFQHPEPMRIMPDSDYVYFVYCPSVETEWIMEPGKDYVFQYRIFVHEGKPNLEDIERIWNDYADPPKVKIETSESSNRIVLFDGTDFSQWVAERNGPVHWEIEDGAMRIVPRTGGIITKDNYSDFKMHLEFKYPDMDPSVRGQSRSNSGVYIQRRYEVQILDSYGLESRNNDCGAIYQFKAPDKNACAKPEEWQTYDITFRAARYDGNTKVENARITVVQNGITIHDNVEIPNKTGAGQQEGPNPAPILLQEHSNVLWFRNIWIEPL